MSKLSGITRYFSFSPTFVFPCLRTSKVISPPPRFSTTKKIGKLYLKASMSYGLYKGWNHCNELEDPNKRTYTDKWQRALGTGLASPLIMPFKLFGLGFKILVFRDTNVQIKDK